MTLTDRELQRLRNQAKTVMSVGVETGGSNVQFAVNPQNGDTIVIEMNPRVSRSSALASKATGFPIAKIAALLAVAKHARRDPQRYHQGHAGLVRAEPRLRGGEDPTLGLREVPGVSTQPSARR